MRQFPRVRIDRRFNTIEVPFDVIETLFNVIESLSTLSIRFSRRINPSEFICIKSCRVSIISSVVILPLIVPVRYAHVIDNPIKNPKLTLGVFDAQNLQRFHSVAGASVSATGASSTSGAGVVLRRLSGLRTERVF